MHFHLHPRFTLLTYHHPSSFELAEEKTVSLSFSSSPSCFVLLSSKRECDV
tara:strand:- start:2016 stop:2168 length:153 start_codon:yes stop_codon:yes gene_type:complete